MNDPTIRCTYTKSNGEITTVYFMSRDAARVRWRPGLTPPYIQVCQDVREGLTRFLRDVPLHHVILEETTDEYP